jgi:hypothetical protein
LAIISETGAMQETWQLILQLQTQVENEISPARLCLPLYPVRAKSQPAGLCALDPRKIARLGKKDGIKYETII